MTRHLILLRHGESSANAADVFSGWLDVGLTDRGRAEAVRAAELLDSDPHVPAHPGGHYG